MQLVWRNALSRFHFQTVLADFWKGSQGRIQEKIGFFGVKSWFFTRNTPTISAPPSAIGKNMIFWRKIVIFHTKYPNNFRASFRSVQFFQVRPPLTWNPGSAPAINILEASRGTIFKPAELHALWIISIYIGSTHAIWR